MINKSALNTVTQLSGWKVAALAVGSALLLAGCAGTPPTEQMAVSKSRVSEAVSSGGVEFAAVETRSAQDKLKQAELEMQDENYEEAKRLAEQAEWDARVAVRKTEAAKAQELLKDAQQGIEELRQEGMRGMQSTPAQGQ
ncbi:MAG: DUF4398 domain-containing protein [Halopseudomonas sabulinigri]|mgnify:FL=1